MMVDVTGLSFAALMALSVFHVAWAALVDEAGGPSDRRGHPPVASRRYPAHRARRKSRLN